MKSYLRVILGKSNVHAPECFSSNFIGTDFGIHEDLSQKLPEQYREFNKEFIPVYLAIHPDKTKVGAGLACGALWTISKWVKKGDIILSPDGTGSYKVGEIAGDYYYVEDQPLPHRRQVKWSDKTISRFDMSETLRNSSRSIATVCDVSKYGEEIDKLINDIHQVSPIVASDPTIEDPIAFAMEKHLEDFLVSNWNQTELSKDFLIYEDEGEIVGRQYPTDTGPLDILAISKDRKRLLVVELKRGRASDVVVGQILRYMGYIKEEVAEEGQIVEGVIIALEDDQKLRRALAAVPTVSFYRYQVSFKLVKSDSIQEK